MRPIWFYNLVLLVLCMDSCCAWAGSNLGQFSGVNNIQFKQSQYNNAFAGNGFLVEYNNELFAVTVKHVLFEAKTPKIKAVSLAGEVTKWTIHPLNQPDNLVHLGELLNDNPDETLDMNILNSDWLVFNVKANHSNLRPLRIRHEPLRVGEMVTAYGCSYIDKKTCSQNAYAGQFKSYEPYNLRVDIGDIAMSEVRGLSGSPVVDNNGRLVGIVSNMLPAKDSSSLDFAPARINYLLDVLNNSKQ